MFKKVFDVISLASLAVFLGDALWVAILGESPPVLGHLSIPSKIAIWSGVPLTFGFSWLIVRYANAAREKFPLVFGSSGRRGLLFYFVAIFGGAAVLLTWIDRLSR